MTNMQKNKGLLDQGYTGPEVDIIIEILGAEIRQCTRQVRNIDLTINNDVLLRQYDNMEPAKKILTRQKLDYLARRKSLKLLVNKITGDEVYKLEELKDE